jgi:O-antigen/teichoic acid export membrane protein
MPCWPRPLSRFIKGHRELGWAFADQAVVSGSNFVAGIVLARILGPHSFGVFVLLWAVLLYVNTFQNPLVFQPMLSTGPQLPAPSRKAYLERLLAVQLLLALLVSLLAFLVLLVVGHLRALPDAFDTPLAFGTALLAFQLHEWQRRVYFALEKPQGAVLIDVVCYGALLIALLVAGSSASVAVSTAYWIIAASFLGGFVTGAAGCRLFPAFRHAAPAALGAWRAGRNLLGGWQAQWLGSQGVVLVTAGLLGAQSVAGMRTAWNVMGPITIIFMAIENTAPVTAARRYAEGGLTPLLKYMSTLAVMSAVVVIPILVTVSIFSQQVVRLFYGEPYVPFAPLVPWSAACMAFIFCAQQKFIFLRTMQATQPILHSAVLGAVAAILSASVAVPWFDEVGAVASLTIGAACGWAHASVAAHRLVSRIRAATPLVGGATLASRRDPA